MSNHETFLYGKEIKGDEKKPLKGPAKTNLDVYNKKNGELVQRRKYDEAGFACKDLDKRHKSHKESLDHAHDIEEGKRGPKRALTKQEQRELAKASKKRRFWND